MSTGRMLAVVLGLSTLALVLEHDESSAATASATVAVTATVHPQCSLAGGGELGFVCTKGTVRRIDVVPAPADGAAGVVVVTVNF